MAVLNILIVRVSSLGDVVHNMPMVADIKRHFPDAQIDWVVEEAYVGLIRLNPYVRNIIPIALRRWRKTPLQATTRAELSHFYRSLRAEAYDFVFDTQGLLKTGIVMRLARLAPGGRRVGLANATEGSGYEPLSRVFHTDSVTVGLHEHAVQRARLVAATAMGYPIDNADASAGHRIDFGLPQGSVMDTIADPAWSWLPQQPYVVLLHATARAAKQWAPANWIALAQALSQRGLTVLLPWGSASEQRAAHALAASMPGAIVLPKLSVTDAVRVLSGAALVVGLDTGLTHIAAACRRPTIELYCDSPRWKTEGNWDRCIVNLGDIGQPPTLAQALEAVSR